MNISFKALAATILAGALPLALPTAGLFGQNQRPMHMGHMGTMTSPFQPNPFMFRPTMTTMNPMFFHHHDINNPRDRFEDRLERERRILMRMNQLAFLESASGFNPFLFGSLYSGLGYGYPAPTPAAVTEIPTAAPNPTIHPPMCARLSR